MYQNHLTAHVAPGSEQPWWNKIQMKGSWRWSLDRNNSDFYLSAGLLSATTHFTWKYSAVTLSCRQLQWYWSGKALIFSRRWQRWSEMIPCRYETCTLTYRVRRRLRVSHSCEVKWELPTPFIMLCSPCVICYHPIQLQVHILFTWCCFSCF